MPKSNAAATASGMLSGLKSRLGFAHDEDESFSQFDAAFNDYDDFDDDGYTPHYDNEYAGYGADYDESAPVGAYRSVTTKRPSRFGRADSTPNLVSIDDVKERTSSSGSSASRAASSASSSTASSARRTSNRSLIGPSGPAPSSPAHTASLRESQAAQSRSEGLDSLFEPSGAEVRRTASSSQSASSRSGRATSSVPENAGERDLKVIKPVSYNDVEIVAKSLKAGKVVVLAMRSTPADLMQRILDFSFGVASAFEANVECPAEKVFAIARGAALSADEKARLRSQGVL